LLVGGIEKQIISGQRQSD